jgi:1,2-diacylglycerol 3-alpha-glucosyltransferase
MKLLIYWEDFLHYHVARIKALQVLGERERFTAHAVALRPRSPELPLVGYHDLLERDSCVLNSDNSRGGPNSRKTASEMVALLDRLQPDAVLIPGYENRVALETLRWCRRNRRGAVLMSESQEGDFPRTWYVEKVKRLIIKQFDALLVGGERHVRYAEKLGVDPNVILTRYDVVDNDFWANQAKNVRSQAEMWRRRLHLPAHFFLSSCRLVEKKNVAGLLRAYKSYAGTEQDAAWPLIIAGDGPLMSELEGLRQGLNLEKMVEFRGYMSAEQLAPHYALASVFVLASSHSEQWGLVVNEAMAAGLPVLVSEICGCVPDLVKVGMTGFTFLPSDENQLVQLLSVFSRGTVDLTTMGEAAVAEVASYSPQNFARNALRAAEVAAERGAARLRSSREAEVALSLVTWARR